MKLKRKVQVKIPASSSNFGPGFDTLGLAFKLYNELELEAEKVSSPGQSGVCIEIEGEGEEILPRNEKNIVWQSAKEIFRACRVPISSYRFHLKMMNRIPLSRGLGSSAAARLGGILAANAIAGQKMRPEELIRWAVKMEGHPDNVVPQMVGGFCICAVLEDKIQFIKLSVPKKISAVVCLPDFELPTKKAQAILPKKISHQDAVFNVSRVALLIGALAKGESCHLKTAMEDRLHQKYRKKFVPGFDRVIKNAYQQGALGVALSGAGPSILAFAPNGKARQIGLGMEKGFLSSGKKSKSIFLDIDNQGAQVKTFSH